MPFFVITSCLSSPASASVAAETSLTDSELAFTQLPAGLGTIKTWQSSGSHNGPFVFHIQDAHANPSAQESIRKILHWLNDQSSKRGAPFSVFVEGASGELHPEYLDLVPGDASAGDAAVKDLAGKGELSGADLFAWDMYLANGTGTVKGAEDSALYRDNLKTYRELLYARGEIDALLAPAADRLERESSRVFSPKLREFLKERRLRKQGDYGTGFEAPQWEAYLAYLAREVRETLNIDLENRFEQLRFPQTVRLLLLKKISGSYDAASAESEKKSIAALLKKTAVTKESKELCARFENFAANPEPRRMAEDVWAHAVKYRADLGKYKNFWKWAAEIILQSEVRAETLSSEMDLLEGWMFKKLAATPAEKDLLAVIEAFNLFEKLLRAQLTHTDFAKVTVSGRLGKKLAGQAYLKKAFSDKLLKYEQSAVHFYDGALRRDQILADRSTASFQQGVVALIAGGFHTQGLENILNDNGAGYAVIQPEITQSDKGDHYSRVLKEENADLSAYFENPFLNKQEAIFLKAYLEMVPVPAVPGSANPARTGTGAAVVAAAINRHPVLSGRIHAEPSLQANGFNLTLTPEQTERTERASAVSASASMVAPDDLLQTPAKFTAGYSPVGAQSAAFLAKHSIVEIRPAGVTTSVRKISIQASATKLAMSEMRALPVEIEAALLTIQQKGSTSEEVLQAAESVREFAQKNSERARPFYFTLEAGVAEVADATEIVAGHVTHQAAKIEANVSQAFTLIGVLAEMLSVESIPAGPALEKAKQALTYAYDGFEYSVKWYEMVVRKGGTDSLNATVFPALQGFTKNLIDTDRSFPQLRKIEDNPIGKKIIDLRDALQTVVSEKGVTGEEAAQAAQGLIAQLNAWLNPAPAAALIAPMKQNWLTGLRDRLAGSLWKYPLAPGDISAQRRELFETPSVTPGTSLAVSTPLPAAREGYVRGHLKAIDLDKSRKLGEYPIDQMPLQIHRAIENAGDITYRAVVLLDRATAVERLDRVQWLPLLDAQGQVDPERVSQFITANVIPKISRKEQGPVYELHRGVYEVDPVAADVIARLGGERIGFILVLLPNTGGSDFPTPPGGRGGPRVPVPSLPPSIDGLRKLPAPPVVPATLKKPGDVPVDSQVLVEVQKAVRSEMRGRRDFLRTAVAAAASLPVFGFLETLAAEALPKFSMTLDELAEHLESARVEIVTVPNLPAKFTVYRYTKNGQFYQIYFDSGQEELRAAKTDRQGKVISKTYKFDDDAIEQPEIYATVTKSLRALIPPEPADPSPVLFADRKDEEGYLKATLNLLDKSKQIELGSARPLVVTVAYGGKKFRILYQDIGRKIIFERHQLEVIDLNTGKVGLSHMSAEDFSRSKTFQKVVARLQEIHGGQPAPEPPLPADPKIVYKPILATTAENLEQVRRVPNNNIRLLTEETLNGYEGRKMLVVTVQSVTPTHITVIQSAQFPDKRFSTRLTLRIADLDETFVNWLGMTQWLQKHLRDQDRVTVEYWEGDESRVFTRTGTVPSWKASGRGAFNLNDGRVSRQILFTNVISLSPQAKSEMRLSVAAAPKPNAFILNPSEADLRALESGEYYNFESSGSGIQQSIIYHVPADTTLLEALQALRRSTNLRNLGLVSVGRSFLDDARGIEGTAQQAEYRGRMDQLPLKAGDLLVVVYELYPASLPDVEHLKRARSEMRLSGADFVALDKLATDKLTVTGVHNLSGVKDEADKMKQLAALNPTGILIRSNTKVSDEFLTQLQTAVEATGQVFKLEHVIRLGHGLDNVTFTPAKFPQIKVRGTKGSAKSIAAWALRATALAAARHLRQPVTVEQDQAPSDSFLPLESFQKASAEKIAKRPEAERALLQAKSDEILAPVAVEAIESMRGLVVGVIGPGNIGEELIARYRELGVTVWVNSSTMERDATARPNEADYRFAEKDEIYQYADFVVVLTGLKAATKGMIGEHAVELMSNNPDLKAVINPDRGKIVNEAAMKKLLERKGNKVLYVVDDVPDSEELRQLALHTDHIGGTTAEAENSIRGIVDGILQELTRAEMRRDDERSSRHFVLSRQAKSEMRSARAQEYEILDKFIANPYLPNLSRRLEENGLPVGYVTFDYGTAAADIRRHLDAGTPYELGLKLIGTHGVGDAVTEYHYQVVVSPVAQPVLAAEDATLLSNAVVSIESYLDDLVASGAIDSRARDKDLSQATLNLKAWLSDPEIDTFSPLAKDSVREAIRTGRWADLIEAFRQNITFGTAGIRGMAAYTPGELEEIAKKGIGAQVLKGPNTINDVVLLKTVAGLIRYMQSHDEHKVVIGYDSRVAGSEFAELIAKAFAGASTAAHPFEIFLFDEASPFPELSFAVTVQRADKGILISASHNPSNYNGFKITDRTGAQLTGTLRDAIVAAIGSASLADIKLKNLAEVPASEFTWLGGSVPLSDKDYQGHSKLVDMHSQHVAQVKKFVKDPDMLQKNAASVHVGFAAFNGAGNKAVPRLLSELGFTNTKVVESLQELNGLFPAFGWGEQPDPGDPIAADIAVRAFIEEHGQPAFDALDLLIGTDPDADRAGMIVKVPAEQQAQFGKYKLLSANDAETLLLWYRFQREADLHGGIIPDREKKYITFSHVTTDALEAVAAHFGIASRGEMLSKQGQPAGGYLDDRRSWVGFSYIAAFADKMRKLGYINEGGAEESNGFSILGGPVEPGEVLGAGGHVNDKDGTLKAVLLAEAAAYAKSKGTTLFEMLDEIYRIIGYYATANKPLPRVGAFFGPAGKAKKIRLLQQTQEWLDQANQRAATDQPLMLVGRKVIGAVQWATGRYDDQHYPGFPDEGVRFFFEDPGLKPGEPFTKSRNYITIRPSGTSQTIRFYTQFHASVRQGNIAQIKSEREKDALQAALWGQLQLMQAAGFSEGDADYDAVLAQMDAAGMSRSEMRSFEEGQQLVSQAEANLAQKQFDEAAQVFRRAKELLLPISETGTVALQKRSAGHTVRAINRHLETLDALKPALPAAILAGFGFAALEDDAQFDFFETALHQLGIRGITPQSDVLAQAMRFAEILENRIALTNEDNPDLRIIDMLGLRDIEPQTLFNGKSIHQWRTELASLNGQPLALVTPQSAVPVVAVPMASAPARLVSPTQPSDVVLVLPAPATQPAAQPGIVPPARFETIDGIAILQIPTAEEIYHARYGGKAGANQVPLDVFAGIWAKYKELVLAGQKITAEALTDMNGQARRKSFQVGLENIRIQLVEESVYSFSEDFFLQMLKYATDAETKSTVILPRDQDEVLADDLFSAYGLLMKGGRNPQSGMRTQFSENIAAYRELVEWSDKHRSAQVRTTDLQAKWGLNSSGEASQRRIKFRKALGALGLTEDDFIQRLWRSQNTFIAGSAAAAPAPVAPVSAPIPVSVAPVPVPARPVAPLTAASPVPVAPPAAKPLNLHEIASHTIANDASKVWVEKHGAQGKNITPVNDAEQKLTGLAAQVAGWLAQHGEADPDNLRGRFDLTAPTLFAIFAYYRLAYFKTQLGVAPRTRVIFLALNTVHPEYQLRDTRPDTKKMMDVRDLLARALRETIPGLQNAVDPFSYLVSYKAGETRRPAYVQQENAAHLLAAQLPESALKVFEESDSVRDQIQQVLAVYVSYLRQNGVPPARSVFEKVLTIPGGEVSERLEAANDFLAKNGFQELFLLPSEPSPLFTQIVRGAVKLSVPQIGGHPGPQNLWQTKTFRDGYDAAAVGRELANQNLLWDKLSEWLSKRYPDRDLRSVIARLRKTAVSETIPAAPAAVSVSAPVAVEKPAPAPAMKALPTPNREVLRKIDLDAYSHDATKLRSIYFRSLGELESRGLPPSRPALTKIYDNDRDALSRGEKELNKALAANGYGPVVILSETLPTLVSRIAELLVKVANTEMTTEKAILTNLIERFTAAPSTYTESNILSALGSENDAAWSQLYTWASSLGQTQGETFVHLATALRQEAAEHAAAAAKQAVVPAAETTTPPAAAVSAPDAPAPKPALAETDLFAVLQQQPVDNNFGTLSIKVRMKTRARLGAFLSSFGSIRRQVGMGEGTIKTIDRVVRDRVIRRDHNGKGSFDMSLFLEANEELVVNVFQRSEMRVPVTVPTGPDGTNIDERLKIRVISVRNMGAEGMVAHIIFQYIGAEAARAEKHFHGEAVGAELADDFGRVFKITGLQERKSVTFEMSTAAESPAEPVALPIPAMPAPAAETAVELSESTSTEAELTAAEESVNLLAAYLSAPQNPQNISTVTSGLLKSPEHQYALDALVYGLEEQDSEVRSLFKVPAGFWESQSWQASLHALKTLFAEALIRDYLHAAPADAMKKLQRMTEGFAQASWKQAVLDLQDGLVSLNPATLQKFVDAGHSQEHFIVGPGHSRINLLKQELARLNRAAEAKSEMRRVLAAQAIDTPNMIETLRLQAAGSDGAFALPTFAREVTRATGGLYEAPEVVAVREGLSLEDALLSVFRAIAQEEGLTLSAEETLPVLKAAREALGEFASLLDAKGENFKLVDLVPSHEFLNNETLYALAIYLLVRSGDDLRLYVTAGNKPVDISEIQVRLETIFKKLGVQTGNLQNRLKLVDAMSWTDEEVLRDVRRESTNRNQRLRTAVLSGRLQWLEALLIVPGQARIQRSITLQKAARILTPAVLSGSEIDERTVQQLTQLLAQKGYSDRLSARFAAMISAVRALVEAA